MNIFGNVLILATVVLVGVHGDNKFLNFDDLAPTLSPTTTKPSPTMSITSGVSITSAAAGFTSKTGETTTRATLKTGETTTCATLKTTCASITKSHGEIVTSAGQTTTCSTVSRINSSVLPTTTTLIPTSVSKLSSFSGSSTSAKPSMKYEIPGENLDELVSDVFGDKNSPNNFSQNPVFFKDSSSINSVYRRVYAPSNQTLPFVSIDFKDREAKKDCRCRCLL